MFALGMEWVSQKKLWLSLIVNLGDYHNVAICFPLRFIGGEVPLSFCI